MTRHVTAEKLGMSFELDSKGKSAVPRVSIEDGIDKATAFWKRLFICSVYCELFIDLIGGYHRKFDESRNIYLEPVHDFTSNAADMLRYASLVEDQFDNEVAKEPEPVQVPVIKDEYVGSIEPNDTGRHPMFDGVDIGKMGHVPPKQ